VCQVEVSATGRLLIQRSPTECVVSSCVIYQPHEWGGLGPRWAVALEEIYMLNTSGWVAVVKEKLLDLINDTGLVFLAQTLPKQSPTTSHWNVHLCLFFSLKYTWDSKYRAPRILILCTIFSEATDGTMCPGVDSAPKNEYQDTPGSKAGRCVRLTTYHLLVLNVKKIRGLNLPDSHVPVQACSGTANPLMPLPLRPPIPSSTEKWPAVFTGKLVGWPHCQSKRFWEERFRTIASTDMVMSLELVAV
jgi:hypothetical protein